MGDESNALDVKIKQHRQRLCSSQLWNAVLAT